MSPSYFVDVKQHRGRSSFPEKATVHSPSAISGTEQRILATYPDLA